MCIVKNYTLYKYTKRLHNIDTMIISFWVPFIQIGNSAIINMLRWYTQPYAAPVRPLILFGLIYENVTYIHHSIAHSTTKCVKKWKVSKKVDDDDYVLEIGQLSWMTYKIFNSWWTTMTIIIIVEALLTP